MHRSDPHHNLSAPTQQLDRILRGPLPDLPGMSMTAMAAELRAMRSGRARRIWRHPGWTALVGWLLTRVPGCDPTTAAIHGVRRSESIIADPEGIDRLAHYLTRVARDSTRARCRAGHVPLTWDPAEVDRLTPLPDDSLDAEAAMLFDEAGIVLHPVTRFVIASSLDISVDWFNDLVERSGLSGLAVIAAARNASGLTEGWRLQHQITGPAARPLISLLLGGDQRGRGARHAAGVEVGLVFWALRRRADAAAGRPAVPTPDAVAAFWGSTSEHVERRLLTPTATPGIQDRAA